MKKLTAILIALCMIIAMCPVVSMAVNTEVNAVRTVYFNSQSEWGTAESSSDGGNVSVLVAYNGSDNWQAANTFTDTDGKTTTQTVTTGTAFNTSRNALIAFEIPEGFDAEKTGLVTLSFYVKKIKQVATGVRFAVYGNSIDGTWSTSANKTTFGASGTDSGLSKLPLLGLTTPVKTSNDGEKVSLTSHTLTDYVKEMAEEGKTEVTFRIAIPYGGAWIYNAQTSTPPELKIEEGTVTTLNVKIVLYDGEEEASSSYEVVDNVVSGSAYTYTDTPKTTIVVGEDVYKYSAEKSTLSVEVLENGESEIILAYEKQENVKSFSGYEIEPEGAWCWFGDPRAVNFTNDDGTIDVTVIGYIDVHGSIKATQINNLTGKVDEVLIRTNIQPDDHNNPTFVMIPDGRIVVFYSRHTDEACFWYRVTEKPGDITTFGEEKCLETSANTTYPSPFILSDDPEHIYLCWRGIEWHPTIAKLTLPDENGNMAFDFGPYQIVRSTNTGNNVRPYAKYATNGKDKIYMSYTSTHPDNVSNNWLYFNQIDIKEMTVHDINGNLMRTIANGPLIVDHSNQSHIVDQTGSVRNWLWQVAVAEDGNPVIANVRIDSSKNNHKYYYVKWDGSKWVKTFLTDAGGKYHPSNTEYCYSGGMSIDVDNPNVMYCSKPVEGLFGKVWEIFKYTMSEDGTEVVSVEQITENSQKNNVRPWAIPNSEGKDLRIMWMNGDYDFWMVNSQYPAGYPTRIMGEVELPKAEVNLTDAVVVEDYEDIGGAFISTPMTANNVYENKIDGAFTASADIYLDGDYRGDVLDMGNVKVGIESIATKYGDDSEPLADRPRVVVKINDTECVTSNVYGTSDEWKNHNIRTGGEYFFTKYDKYVNHTIVYDGEYLTLYRDGLIDLKEKVALDGVEYVRVGGFDGLCENATVYERALNHDEIKTLCGAEYDVVYPEAEGTDEITLNYLTSTGEALKETEVLALNPGTDYYNFIPEEYVLVVGDVFKLYSSEFDRENMLATAVYERYNSVGDNLVPDGDFTDDEGNFSWGTWQTPKADGGYENKYFKDNCNEWFYKVDKATDNAVLYPVSMTAEDFALGTRWNDGTLGLCSMANFIPVKAGKTYYVSYDYKHTAAGTDASYISTAFVSEKDFALNASGNNVPKSVTTSWQTNKFAITAPEDGYIYFHFSHVGGSGNLGNGPYWYFDNFRVYATEKETIKTEIISADNERTVVQVKNLSVDDIEDIKVYAASCSADGEVIKAESKLVSVKANDAEELTFDVSGVIKVFAWDNDMNPLYKAIEKEPSVMVVTKVATTLLNGKETLKLSGIKDGGKAAVYVNPEEAESTVVETGNVILYDEKNALAENVRILFSATEDAPADAVETGIENILSEEFSDNSVTIHYGTPESLTGYVLAMNGHEYVFTDSSNVIVCDYTYYDVNITAGHRSDAKPGRYTKTVFIKTKTNSENEIADAVVFIVEN